MAQVQRIDPIILPAKETVAAYCRVSTDSKDQLNSYQTQISYYTQLIAENPDWELVDIYADAGITGTSIEKRDEFKRMMADCRAGKIKRVLVKSVSRFARNTLELLEATRELRELGVVVVFEEQGIDTSQMLGEMQLTMFALAAQEESTSISKNMRWSYQKRMENGQFVGTRVPYGYQLKDGLLEIVPSEAKTVRTVFESYLSGMGINRIVDLLKSGEITSPNKNVWTYSAVKYMLTNERYIGDALLQKSCTVDSLGHTRKKNNGIQPRFYMSSRHEAIIQADTFRKVQMMLASKNKYQGLERHFPTNKIVCPDCGKHFRRMNCSGKFYWICYSRASRPSNCTPYRFPELRLVITTLNLLSRLYLNQDEIILTTLSLLREIEYTQTGSDSKLFELGKAIAHLNDKALVLQRLQNKGFITAEEFRARNDALAAQRAKLSAERKRKLSGSKAHEMIEKIEELQATLASWPGVPTEFDIDVFDEIVEKIIPAEDGTLRFRLRCGLELKEAMPK